jgi:endonuclease/exonuclease/phosphatase family metal-dependent hydrolase
MQTLRLLTLNIWSNKPPWVTRKRLIQKGLGEEAPELVALQEVLQPHGHGSSQAHELAEGLGYRVAFSRACRIDKPFPSEYGIALLSRFPIREHRTVPLPTPEGIEPRAVLYALCSVKVGVLPVLVTHLSWEPELGAVRAAQLAHIDQLIRAELAALPHRLPAHVPILPPVLLGDLNAGPERPEVRSFLADAGFIDCFAATGEGPGLTMDPRNPGATKQSQVLSGRIDYVLLGSTPAGQARPLRARVCLDRAESAVFPSDHFGVLAEIGVG